MQRPWQDAYWSRTGEALLAELQSAREGLSSAEAGKRLAATGPNSMGDEAGVSASTLLLRQIASPLVLVLILGALLSMLLQQWSDAAIILVIVLASAILGFSQEYAASTALLELKRRLALTAKAMRDGRPVEIPASELVPGDIVRLSAGNLVPADGVLLDASDFLVSESALTGESMPVEKRIDPSPADAPLSSRANCVFAGTSVRSGMASVLIVATGAATSLGQLGARLGEAEPDTDFEKGVRKFGYLLIRVMIIMVLAVLIVTQLLHRPVIESLLFAVALAVGMTPELLPAIVTVTLSAGARDMAKEGVIVRRLEALENLGSMDVLCTDKTGTLTEGRVSLVKATDADGNASSNILRLAFLNSSFETGIENPMDQAIVEAGTSAGLATDEATKIDEIPYDFMRKRLTIVLRQAGDDHHHLIISKGSPLSVVDVCSAIRIGAREVTLEDTGRSSIRSVLETQGKQGYRVLAVATRTVEPKKAYSRTDEQAMTFEGFLLFADPPKADVRQAIANLSQLGIALKVISGDNREVVVHVANSIGIDTANVLTGAEVAAMKSDALDVHVDSANLFVEIDPQQKERIILALKRRGHAVGYLGDGINDAPALHAADVGISVDQAVDVARQSADIVLLQRDLDVLRAGVVSGRRTFANTLKYISITTSANFGNMLSMALATPLLPFLPLLAKQILFNNFLSDIPSLAISTDNVDEENIATPQRWDVQAIGRFMIVFGLVSSLFDLLSFGLLLYVLKASEVEFRTAWFIISLLTEVAVVLVLRTHKPAWSSKPSPLLLTLTALVSIAALLLPYLGFIAKTLGFAALPIQLLPAVVLIVLGYIITTEVTKLWYYRKRPTG